MSILKAKFFYKLAQTAAGQASNFKRVYTAIQQLAKTQINPRIKTKLEVLGNKLVELTTLKEFIDDYNSQLETLKLKISPTSLEGKKHLEQAKQELFSELKGELLEEGNELGSYEEIFEDVNSLYGDIISTIQELIPLQDTSAADLATMWAEIAKIPDLLSDVVSIIPDEIIDTNAIQSQFQEAGNKGEFFDLSVNVSKKDTSDLNSIRQAREFKARKARTLDELRARLDRSKRLWAERKEREAADPSLRQRRLDLFNKSVESRKVAPKEDAEMFELELMLEKSKAHPAKYKVQELESAVQEARGRISALQGAKSDSAKQFYARIRGTTQNTIRKALALFNAKKATVKGSLTSVHHGVQGPFAEQTSNLMLDQMDPTKWESIILQAINSTEDFDGLTPDSFQVVEISVGDKKQRIDFQNKLYAAYSKFAELSKLALLAKAKQLAIYKLLASSNIGDARAEKAKKIIQQYNQEYVRAVKDISDEVSRIINTVEEFGKMIGSDIAPGQAGYAERLKTVIEQIYPIADEIYRRYTDAAKDPGMDAVFDMKFDRVAGAENEYLPTLHGLAAISEKAYEAPVLNQKLAGDNILPELGQLIKATRLTIKLMEEAGSDLPEDQRTIMLQDDLGARVPGMDVSLEDALKAIAAGDATMIAAFKKPELIEQLRLLQTKFGGTKQLEKARLVRAALVKLL
jgi:hypothetical protein